MGLVLLLGGARAGKSALAVGHARRVGGPVVFVATAEPLDDEMRDRIARHRAERDAGWQTVEEPLALEEALAAAPPGACVVVDCLSLWTANLIARGDDEAAVAGAAQRAARLAAARVGPTYAVSNEVGWGVVPASPLGRRYRDVHGRVNRIWAEHAEEALLVVAGRGLELRALE
ncbi:MAG TPA: bifunctional adenosylcobinamide kinase/adenosylcobinamide-phosphate guanylyltransferase [Capillimicrobium sp.]